MGAAYSQDLRDKVLQASDRGMSNPVIASGFGVSEAWVRRVTQRRREKNESTPRPMGGKRFEKIDRIRLAQLIAKHPDATLVELRQALGIICALSAIGAAVKKAGFSFKKRRSMPRNKTARTSSSGGRGGFSGGRGSTRDD